MSFYYHYKKYLILGGILLLIGLLFVYYLTFNKKEKIVYINKTTNTTKMVNSFFVDVKGAVKQPGVYEFLEGDKVIDAIKQAGGLTSNAYTSNINLSKKLSNEMVVYVFKKSEITTPTTTANNPCNCETIQVDNCINKEENTSSSKVNINTADVNILSTLSGIGEAKAKAIIDYRTQNGLFKTIEDIKNVSGLGDSLFAKIKDSITV